MTCWKWLILAIVLSLGLPSLALAQGVVRVDAGDTVTPITDVVASSSATLVRAASAERVALSCTNTDASVAVRWGDSTITTTKGQQLPAGASIEIRTLSAIYMISESTAVNVACTEELR